MLREHKFQIEPQHARQRLDEFLALRFGSLSRMRIANLIEAGACIVNGAPGKAGYRIIVGDTVEFTCDDDALTSMFPERMPLEVVHEDDHIIVVVKPAGMLVHPTLSVKSGTLANALAYHLNRPIIEDEKGVIDYPSSIVDSRPIVRPGLVHRLDRATSGLMVVAKTRKALATLSRHFRRRLVEKRYLALVHGVVSKEAGSVNAPIGRDPDQQPVLGKRRWRVREDGRHAETRFEVIERLVNASLLELEPVTGRTNQLRIHCAHMGHPIVGDEMHADCGLRIPEWELEPERSLHSESAIDNRQSAIRLCLHAWKLAFHHPANGEWMSFCSPPPEEFVRIAELYRAQTQ